MEQDLLMQSKGAASGKRVHGGRSGLFEQNQLVADVIRDEFHMEPARLPWPLPK